MYMSKEIVSTDL